MAQWLGADTGVWQLGLESQLCYSQGTGCWAYYLITESSFSIC